MVRSRSARSFGTDARTLRRGRLYYFDRRARSIPGSVKVALQQRRWHLVWRHATRRGDGSHLWVDGLDALSGSRVPRKVGGTPYNATAHWDIIRDGSLAERPRGSASAWGPSASEDVQVGIIPTIPRGERSVYSSAPHFVGFMGNAPRRYRLRRSAARPEGVQGSWYGVRGMGYQGTSQVLAFNARACCPPSRRVRRATPTSSRKSGWGRSGRDRNSGWNWTPTIKG